LVFLGERVERRASIRTLVAEVRRIRCMRVSDLNGRCHLAVGLPGEAEGRSGPVSASQSPGQGVDSFSGVTSHLSDSACSALSVVPLSQQPPSVLMRRGQQEGAACDERARRPRRIARGGGGARRASGPQLSQPASSRASLLGPPRQDRTAAGHSLVRMAPGCTALPAPEAFAESRPPLS